MEQMHDIDWDPHTTSGVITKAATEVAQRIDAKFLVAFTHSGDAARRLARLRSRSRSWRSRRSHARRRNSPCAGAYRR